MLPTCDRVSLGRAECQRPDPVPRSREEALLLEVLPRLPQEQPDGQVHPTQGQKETAAGGEAKSLWEQLRMHTATIMRLSGISVLPGLMPCTRSSLTTLARQVAGQQPQPAASAAQCGSAVPASKPQGAPAAAHCWQPLAAAGWHA